MSSVMLQAYGRDATHGTEFRELLYPWHPWAGLRARLHESSPSRMALSLAVVCTAAGLRFRPGCSIDLHAPGARLSGMWVSSDLSLLKTVNYRGSLHESAQNVRDRARSANTRHSSPEFAFFERDLIRGRIRQLRLRRCEGPRQPNKNKRNRPNIAISWTRFCQCSRCRTLKALSCSDPRLVKISDRASAELLIFQVWYQITSMGGVWIARKSGSLF
jgi:hypothetical protein